MASSWGARCTRPAHGVRPTPRAPRRGAPTHARSRGVAPRALGGDEEGGGGGGAPPTAAELAAAARAAGSAPGGRPRRQAESTDAVATFMTRRFGLKGGLAWLGVLTFGVVSEQVKTRLEVSREAGGTRDVDDAREVVLPSGVRFTETRVGGGELPVDRGFLVAAKLKISDASTGEVLQDTGRATAWYYGARPFGGGVCKGVEEVLSTMRNGGKRKAFVPGSSAFPEGFALSNGDIIKPGLDLSYEIELVRVSIPPS